jgi:hypothetical protein
LMEYTLIDDSSRPQMLVLNLLATCSTCVVSIRVRWRQDVT